MFQNVYRVFWLFVSFWSFNSFNYDVCNTISNCWSRSSVTLLHFNGQRYMSGIWTVNSVFRMTSSFCGNCLFTSSAIFFLAFCPITYLFESPLVITSNERSILFCSKSLITPLQYSIAPSLSNFKRRRSRAPYTIYWTSPQLSLRTVSIPLASILSGLSGFVQYIPAYLFLAINK